MSYSGLIDKKKNLLKKNKLYSLGAPNKLSKSYTPRL
jgi:hypothetical protein